MEELRKPNEKNIRGNQMSLFIKGHPGATIERTNLRNKFLRSKADQDKKLYANQCTVSQELQKKNCYKKLNINERLVW